MTDRYTFSPRHLGLLAHTRESLEAGGFTCTVEVTTMTRHEFELHTLVAEPPKKLNPIKFTRAGESLMSDAPTGSKYAPDTNEENDAKPLMA